MNSAGILVKFWLKMQFLDALVKGVLAADAAGNDDSYDQSVDGNDTGHDDGNYGLHDQFGSHDGHGGDTGAWFCRSISGAECWNDNKKKAYNTSWAKMWRNLIFKVPWHSHQNALLVIITNKPINQSINQSIDQSSEHYSPSTRFHSTYRLNQSINRPNYSSIRLHDQSINQSIDQSTGRSQKPTDAVRRGIHSINLYLNYKKDRKKSSDSAGLQNLPFHYVQSGGESAMNSMTHCSVNDAFKSGITSTKSTSRFILPNFSFCSFFLSFFSFR